MSTRPPIGPPSAGLRSVRGRCCCANRPVSGWTRRARSSSWQLETHGKRRAIRRWHGRGSGRPPDRVADRSGAQRGRGRAREHCVQPSARRRADDEFGFGASARRPLALDRRWRRGLRDQTRDARLRRDPSRDAARRGCDRPPVFLAESHVDLRGRSRRARSRARDHGGRRDLRSGGRFDPDRSPAVSAASTIKR